MVWRSRMNACRVVAVMVVTAGTLWAAATAATTPERAAPSDAAERAPFYPPFLHPLFDQPLVLAGSFGDHRSNHFHAGLDLSTGGVVGRAVHAPMDGEVVRVRASGAGYGRSLYVQTSDGRLLVFGHLDGFAPKLAAYMAGVQDSSGQYDQDLWPAAGRFRVRGGDIVGWTGRSGTGSPHLHFEVRRADTAMHPLRAGLTVKDTSTPRIVSVTLVPANDTSFVWTADRRLVTNWATENRESVHLGERDSSIVLVSGRFRVVVEALDANGKGGWDIEPWRVRAACGGDWVEARFDTVSWATDMPQSDYVYDSGRWTKAGATSLLLAAPAGFRPKVIRSSAPERDPAGAFLAPAGQFVRLEIEAEDLAGHVGRRSVLIKAHPPESLQWAILHRAPSAVREIADVSKPDHVGLHDTLDVRFPADALFEPAKVGLDVYPRPSSPAIVPLSPPIAVTPDHLPLRVPAEVVMRLPEGADPRRAAVFNDIGDGWEFVGNDYDAAHGTIAGSTRKLGRLLLAIDTLPPSIALLKPPRTVAPSPYPRWSLEAHVLDGGSGVDARTTHFEVDGRRVPTEWDGVVNTMRWRPLHAPKSGTHRVVAIAVDRCGNERRTTGSFVIR